MWADICTKPLQGALFVKFRNLILGIQPQDFDTYKKHYNEILKQYDLNDTTEIIINKSQECVRD